MTLPTSGALSLADIQTEFGGSNPISLSEYYAGGAYVPAGTSGTYGAVPSSGAISIQSFYGTAAVPTFVEASIGSRGGSSSVVPALASVQNGDLIIGIVMNGTSGRTFTAPAGFSSVTSYNAVGPSAAIFTKTASSESGTYTFTASGAGGTQANILVYSPASVHLAGSWNNANSATQTALSISPSVGGVLIAAFAFKTNTTVTTPPSGMTQRAFFNTTASSNAQYELSPSPSGTTGNKSIVWNNADDGTNILLQIV